MGSLWQGANQPVHTLMWREPSDEQHARAGIVPMRCKPLSVGPAVDHAGAITWRRKYVCGVLRNRKKPVEQSRENPEPIASTETVVGYDGTLAHNSCARSRHAAWCTSHVVGMYHIGIAQPRKQPERQGMCRMTMQVHDGRQDAYHKSVGLALGALSLSESHQLAFDMPGQRPGELEGVAFATTEEAFGAEQRRGDVEDPNVGSLLANAGKP